MVSWETQYVTRNRYGFMAGAHLSPGHLEVSGDLCCSLLVVRHSIFGAAKEGFDLALPAALLSQANLKHLLTQHHQLAFVCKDKVKEHFTLFFPITNTHLTEKYICWFNSFSLLNEEN